jgi:hypothetical protein
MPIKQELENTPLTVLAVKCGNIADSPSSPVSVSEEAQKLKLEWARLIERRPLHQSQSTTRYRKEKESLKARMVEFLTQQSEALGKSFSQSSRIWHPTPLKTPQYPETSRM